ncbi:MAG: serine protease [Verrucomicrobia bacterium]|nr:serine protease [Verrucomicrobiota bacterium]
MTTIILLFVAGVMLLAAEIFTPGGVLGVAGAVAMFAGCVMAFSEFGPMGGGVAVVAAAALLGLTLYLELVWLPKSRLGRGLVVQSASDAVSQPPVADEAAIKGKTAEAATTLAPSGYVLVEGRRYEAFCQSGHAGKGETLRVVGLDNFRVIVTKS